MDDLRVKKYLIAMGVPRSLWDWSIDDAPTHHKKVAIEIADDIALFMKNGIRAEMKIEKDQVLASRLAVFLLKCALREDYLNVAYITPVRLATLMANSWEGSEEYTLLATKDMVVIDQISRDNFTDGTKVTAFTQLFTARYMNEKSTVYVIHDRVNFSEVLKNLLDSDKDIVRFK